MLPSAREPCARAEGGERHREVPTFPCGEQRRRFGTRTEACDDRPPARNPAMHGHGCALGALREVWSTARIRDSEATVTHTVVRLAFEQTVENATWASRPRRGRAANASSPLIGMTPRSKSRAPDVLLAPGLMPSDP